MQIEEANLIRAVGRAYLLGVSTSALLLGVWLLAGTTVVLRGYLRGRTHNWMSLVTAGYALLGFIGYWAVLDPITLRFITSVGIVEPFLLHPWWVRVGIPAALIVAWFSILRRARRKTALAAASGSTLEVPQ
jgi:hypothetical protein